LNGERQPHQSQPPLLQQSSIVFEVVVPTLHQRTFGEVNQELLHKTVNEGAPEKPQNTPMEQITDPEKGLGTEV